jgi:hypothetical protein
MPNMVISPIYLEQDSVRAKAFIYSFVLVSSTSAADLAFPCTLRVLRNINPISQVTTARIINMRKTVPKLFPAIRIASPQFADISSMISCFLRPQNIVYCNTDETIIYCCGKKLSCKIGLFSIKYFPVQARSYTNKGH